MFAIVSVVSDTRDKENLSLGSGPICLLVVYSILILYILFVYNFIYLGKANFWKFYFYSVFHGNKISVSSIFIGIMLLLLGGVIYCITAHFVKYINK